MSGGGHKGHKGHKKHHAHDDHGAHGGHGWLMSFCDLLTLLLCFFIVLLTMRSSDDKKLEEMIGGFTGAFGVLDKSVSTGVSSHVVTPFGTPVPEVVTQDVRTVLANRSRTLGGADRSGDVKAIPPEPKAYRDQFEAERLTDGIETRLGSELLFENDSARLLPSSVAIVREVAADFLPVGASLHIACYVPDTSASAALREDDDALWSLAIDRAAAVAAILSESYGRQRVTIMGYARPAPRLTRLDSSSSVVTIHANTRTLEVAPQGEPHVPPPRAPFDPFAAPAPAVTPLPEGGAESDEVGSPEAEEVGEPGAGEPEAGHGEDDAGEADAAEQDDSEPKHDRKAREGGHHER
jgi:flagellar motor protein MotB